MTCTIHDMTPSTVSYNLNPDSVEEKDSRILIVDDEQTVRTLFVSILSQRYPCSMAADAEEALAHLASEDYALVISDLTMPGMSGVELLREITARFPDTAVIMASGMDSTQHALDAVRLGAFDYLMKPCDIDALELCVEQALERRTLLRDGRRYKEQLEMRNAELAYRMQVEEALRKSEERFKLVTHATNDAIWDWDLVTNEVWWSEGLQKIFGYMAEEIKSDFEFRIGRLHPDDLERVRQGIHKAIDNGRLTWSDEYRFRRGDSSYATVIDRGYVVYDERGQPRRMLGSMMDISERKMLEDQLRQAQKLESIGQLAAGIAHEINTPMQYLGDNTRFLQEAFCDLHRTVARYSQLLEAVQADAATPKLVAEVEATAKEAEIEYLTEEIPKAIQQSLEGVERVTKIVQSMKDFAHPGSAEKKAVDLNKAIESTITVTGNEWRYVAEMKTDFDARLPAVHCLRGEFNQVILNMIVNAAHAIADVVGDGARGKGVITISTRRDGDWAVILISDTGTGIPREVRPRVFDPFFTTKEVGRGTGQGLAIAHSVVVEKHGGTLSFETELGQGTTFIIRLPITEGAGESA